MHHRGAQRGTIAWLAMLALWLLVLAPSISRLLAPASVVPAMAAMCGDHADTTGPHAPADHHNDDPLDACGYCTLISHSAVLTGTMVFSVPHIPVALFVTRLPSQHATLAVVRQQLARGPPSASSRLALAA